MLRILDRIGSTDNYGAIVISKKTVTTWPMAKMTRMTRIIRNWSV